MASNLHTQRRKVIFPSSPSSLDIEPDHNQEPSPLERTHLHKQLDSLATGEDLRPQLFQAPLFCFLEVEAGTQFKGQSLCCVLSRLEPTPAATATFLFPTATFPPKPNSEWRTDCIFI